MNIEYEAASTRAEHVLASKASEADIMSLIDTTFDVIVPVEVHYQRHPQLSDVGDEVVLEAVVNGRADAIVTFSRGDYSGRACPFWDRSEPRGCIEKDTNVTTAV